MQSKETSRPVKERGYSVVEVIIAAALLGVVILSILTLFYLARRNVYSGKQMTQAIAIGNQAMEDLSHLTLQGVYDAFNVTSATSPALGDYSVAGVSYDDVLLRSTTPGNARISPSTPSDISQETTPTTPAGSTGLLTNWRTLLGGNTKLAESSVTVVLAPRDATAGTLLDSNNNATARILRIRVIVNWREEGNRRRSVVFDTVKTRRGA